jgi:hypothetical protein
MFSRKEFSSLFLVLPTPGDRVFLQKLIISQLVRKSPPLKEPDDLIPWSQEPATGPYPDQLIPVHTLTFSFLRIHFTIQPE